MENDGVSHSLEVAPTFAYSYKDFAYTSSSSHNQERKSRFDILLHSKWKAAEDAGHFNYKTDNVETKILPGKYKLVAQLNVNRFKKRRKPEEILSVTQPCDPTKFNFTKIKAKEVLSELEYHKDHAKDCNSEGNCKNGRNLQGSLIINTAPICYSHSMLVPFRNQLKHQVVDHKSLTLALHVALLAHTSEFRIAMNSLAGFASVNHLHFHLYYLPYHLYIETADCIKLAGPCYVFEDYHSPGFVFQLENQDIGGLVSSVMAVIKLFLNEEIAHNIFITRGTSLNGTSPSGCYDTLRLILWGRKPSYGMKDVSVFAAAVCELAGHVAIYSDGQWSDLAEDNIVPVLNEACRETFTIMQPKVKKLFSQD